VEACGTAHYSAQELIALGHEVRLMPAAYVKPYVKRGVSGSLSESSTRIKGAQLVERPRVDGELQDDAARVIHTDEIID
jgi:transposase